MRIAETRKEFCQRIVEQYRNVVGQDLPMQAKEAALWAIRQGLWRPPRRTEVELCARELAEAMREEYVTDPQNRRVRRMHAFRETRGEEQLTFWIDITANPPREKMQVSFQQRRHQVLGDCRQLKTDIDSYNENYNTSGIPIQMSFDFTDDLAELEQPVEYIADKA